MCIALCVKNKDCHATVYDGTTCFLHNQPLSVGEGQGQPAGDLVYTESTCVDTSEVAQVSQTNNYFTCISKRECAKLY